MTDVAVKEQMFAWLDENYNSGQMPAHEVAPWIESEYGLSPEEAAELHNEWIQSFDQRNPQ